MSLYEANLLAQFVSDVISDKYNDRFLFKKYGQDQVEEWRRSDDIRQMLYERRRERARLDVIEAEQWNNFRGAAFDVVAKALRGDLGADHQAGFAKWILSGEKSFIESKAKALGEKAAGQVQTQREPLRIIKDNGN